MSRRSAAAAWVAFTALAVTLKVCEYLSFHVDDFDTGIYSNLVWNVAAGRGFHSGVLGANHLGEHFSPIVAIFAPLYWVSPSPLWLLVAQALAVAVTLPILLRLFEAIAGARAGDRAAWIAMGGVALFLVYRPMWSSLYHEFHPSTLGMPLVAGALLCLHLRANRTLWLFVLALLATKELAVASTAGLAIYACSVLGRRRLALQLAIVAAAAAIIVFGVAMPAFRDGDWGHVDRFAPTRHSSLKLAYLARLALPLGLLPLLGWRALLAAAPTTLVNLAVSYPPQFSLRYHYDDQNCVFWIVAAVHGACWLGDRLDAAAPAARRALWGALSLLIFGVALASSGPSPFRRLVRWWPSAETRSLAAVVARQAALPDELAIASQSTLGPRLGHRLHYRSLRDRDFDAPPFATGERIVLAPALGGFELDVPAALEKLAREPRAERIEQRDGLVVYRWRGEPDAGVQ